MELNFYLGSGKPPQCNVGSIKPIIYYLESKLRKTLLIDKTSTNVLFNLLQSSDKGDVPIICVEEAFKFFANVLSASKITSESRTLNMDRLRKLYDGDYGYQIKGSKAKHVGAL